jgi:heterodisulfide reductase subunit B
MGATPVDWPLRLDCCGNPLWEKNPALSSKLMANKREDARMAGAQILATACTYCQMQFDSVRAAHDPDEKPPDDLTSVLVSQLLGRAMGLPEDALGLEARRLASA